MPTTPTNGKIKVYTLLDTNTINTNTRTYITNTIVSICKVDPAKIQVFDGVVVDFFDGDIANISTEKNSPDQKTAIKIAQETMSNINKALTENPNVMANMSSAYLFPQPLKFADARLLKGKVSENYVLKNPKTIKTAYWEIVFRLEFSSTDTKPIKYPVYGGTVTVSVGIKGLIIGIYSDILPITGSKEVDKFNPLSESGNTLAANPSIVYLFDFKKNTIAPYFLKIPDKKKNTPDAQDIDNYVEDKNFLPPQQQDVYGLGYDALVPACAQSRLLEYGKFECPCNRLLNAGDVYIWVQTIREEPINFSQKYVASIYANKKHKMDKFGLFDLNNKAKALYSTLPETERDIYLFTKYLNETFNCYGINSCNQRMHFFAQTGAESYGFRITTEFADGSAYEGRINLGNTETGDGPRYKGRGLIHLTGRANYERYFHYIADNFQTNKYGERYVNATEKITLETRLLQLLRAGNPALNPTLLDLTPETVYSLLENRANNFHLMVSNSLFFACDAAGWYWTDKTSPYDIRVKAKITETENPNDYKEITLLTNNDVFKVKGYSINRIADLGSSYVELINILVNGGGNAWDKRLNYLKYLILMLKNNYLCNM